jgi:hypothetical protein
MKWGNRTAKKKALRCSVCNDAIKKGERYKQAKENGFIRRHATCRWVLGWPGLWRIYDDEGRQIGASAEIIRPDKLEATMS